MTYEEAKAKCAVIEAAVDSTGDILRAFPIGPMGLTPDSVRATPEWKAAKANFDFAFAKLRAFNGFFVKTFAKEYRAVRRARKAVA